MCTVFFESNSSLSWTGALSMLRSRTLLPPTGSIPNHNHFSVTPNQVALAAVESSSDEGAGWPSSNSRTKSSTSKFIFSVTLLCHLPCKHLSLWVCVLLYVWCLDKRSLICFPCSHSVLLEPFEWQINRAGQGWGFIKRINSESLISGGASSFSLPPPSAYTALDAL